LSIDFNTEFFIDTFFKALSGVPTTLNMTGVTLLISIPLGFLLAIIRVAKVPVITQIIELYVSFIRGTPTVVQIFLVYSIVPGLLAGLLANLNSTVNVYDINPIVYAYIVFSLNTTAILSEVFRSGLFTVEKGQMEAAQAIGLTTFQSYTRIIIPQALVAAVPNLTTATLNLIKMTSLAFIMTVKDITAIAKVEAGFGYNYIEAYMDVFFIYLLLCSIVEFLFKWLEKRLKVYKGATV
jgi:L-cystine transport system permease protein